MSDGLMFVEGTQEYAMIYNSDYGEPWHKKGKPIDKSLSFEEAVASAYANYAVELINIRPVDEDRVAPKHKIVRRVDNHAILGVVGSRYQPIQNTEAYSIFNPLIDRKLIQLESAGVFGVGERMWILGRVGEAYEVVDNDMIQPYVLFSNAHDGTRGLMLLNTGVRVVCKNTETAALEGRKSELTICVRHTAGAGEALEQAQQVIEYSLQYHVSFKAAAQIMARQKMARVELDTILRQIFPQTLNEKTGKMEYSTRAIKAMGTIGELFDNDPMPAVRGTRWAAYNAVTAYADHFRSINHATHLESMWFGSGAELKKKFFSMMVA